MSSDAPSPVAAFLSADADRPWLSSSFDSGARAVLGALKRPPIAILAAMIFLVPLVRVPALEDSFNSPKLALILISLAVLAALRLRSSFYPRDSADLPQLPSGHFLSALVLWGLFSLLQLTSVVWADSKALAIAGLIHLLAGLGTLFLVAVTVRRPAEAAVLLAAGVFSAVITAGWTVMEDALAQQGVTQLQSRLADWRGYLGAGLGNTGHIAGWCGLFLYPLLAAHCLIRRPGVLTYAGLTLVFLAMVVTWSVGSTGSSLLALGIWLLVSWRIRALGSLTAQRTAGVVGLGLLAISFYVFPHPANPHHPSLLSEAFASQRWKDGLPTRQVIYETTLELIRQRPLQGWGVGNFTLHYVQQAPESVHHDDRLRMYAGAYTNDAHNDLLQVTTETGIPGTVLVIAALGIWLTGLIQRLWRWPRGLGERLVLLSCGCGVTVFLLDGLMSFPSRLPAHWMALMLLLGMAMGVSRPMPGSEELSPRRSPQGWFIPAVMLTLVLICLPWQGRRMGAEWILKSARTRAQLAIIPTHQGPMSGWDVLQGQLDLAAEGFRRGDDGLTSGALAGAGTTVSHPEIVRSVSLLERAQRLDPRYTNATSRLSVAWMAQGRWDDAANLLEGIMGDLQSTEILDRLALCYVMTRRKQKAAVLWRELARRQPQLAERYLVLADAASSHPPASSPAGNR